MRLQGQTPIERAAGIPAELRGRLRGLWIESVEEYVALLAAVDRGLSSQALGLSRDDLDRSLRVATSVLAVPKAELLAAPRVGGPLGCRVDPDVMEVFARERKLPRREGRIPAAIAQRLPPSVRLTDRMLPIKDQGARATCVAFAAVALREFFYKRAALLSEQFLYWACKELDGYPGPGTYLRTGMTALGTYGVCRGETWPYNPRQDDSNEGQGPPPPGALDEAKQFIMTHSGTVEPGVVDNYRAVLAGDSKAPGMPVAIATFVFDSWYRSPETHRTGKITLPFPNEDPVGGHAWCVVGYQDDSSVPGGGYFIVRNSWGTDWAAESPEAPGHAVMPYAYVAQYALEAFSGEVPSGMALDDADHGELSSYLRRLEKAARDLEGKLLREGTVVLVNPAAPGEFLEDNPGNRQRFVSRDFTWTDATRQRAWFPATAAFSAETKSGLNAVRLAKERFASAIHQNISSSVGTPFPQLTIPFWLHLVPYKWEPKIKRASQIADLTPDVAEVMRDRSGAPQGLEWPAEWMELLRGINDVRVFAVEGGGRQVHVVSAFLTGLRVQKDRDPNVVPPDQALVAAVRKAYESWLATSGQARPPFVFMTVGSAKCVPDATPSDAGDRLLMLSHLDAGGTWKSRLPKRFGDRLSIRDFLDRLKPETQPERISRIKDCVDALMPEGGNVTVEKVKKRTGYRRSVVRSAFITLQEQAADSYRLYRTSDRQLAIRRPKPGEPISLRAGSFRHGFFRRHALMLLGAAIGVSGWTLRGMLNLSGVIGFAALVLLVYVTSCIQVAINRQASDSKE